MFIDEHVRTLFCAVTARYAGSPMPDAETLKYLHEWERLARDAGISRFKVALERALEHHALPEAEHISDYMPPPRDLDQRKAHDPNCPACDGTGWRRIPSKKRYRAARVRRCKGVEASGNV